jgi:hypothetical protein
MCASARWVEFLTLRSHVDLTSNECMAFGNLQITPILDNARLGWYGRGNEAKNALNSRDDTEEAHEENWNED